MMYDNHLGSKEHEFGENKKLEDGGLPYSYFHMVRTLERICSVSGACPEL